MPSPNDNYHQHVTTICQLGQLEVRKPRITVGRIVTLSGFNIQVSHVEDKSLQSVQKFLLHMDFLYYFRYVASKPNISGERLTDYVKYLYVRSASLGHYPFDGEGWGWVGGRV